MAYVVMAYIVMTYVSRPARTRLLPSIMDSNTRTASDGPLRYIVMVYIVMADAVMADISMADCCAI